MRFVLGALVYLVFVLALPFLLFHRKVRDGFCERLGRHQSAWPDLPAGPRIWIHGASAGDVLALLPLARELRARRADVQIIASTITNSGRVIVEKNRQHFAAVTYLPWDLPGAVWRALRKARPDVLVLEYTELWPHLIHRAARRGTHVVLHNGRFSPARLGRYRMLFWLTGNLLEPMSLLLMRNENEADRARALGAIPQRVHVTGNTKFDNLVRAQPTDQIEALRRAFGWGEGERVWVIGSTHEGEEEILLDVFRSLRDAAPDLRVVIAPRYVERAERVVSLAQKRGFSVRLRSVPGDPTDVVVLDTIGELAACYAIADLVFVGGSFVERGGQNILEPAVCKKPVLFGPHMENFADSVQVLLGRGGIQTATPKQLQRVMADLLSRPEHCRELGEMARERVLAAGKAAARNAELILGLLEERS